MGELKHLQTHVSIKAFSHISSLLGFPSFFILGSILNEINDEIKPNLDRQNLNLSRVLLLRSDFKCYLRSNLPPPH